MLILLLHSIFDGSYGSSEENALEIKLDLLESQKDTIEVNTIHSFDEPICHF